MRANTYRQWRTEPRAPSVSGAPGGVTCGRMAPSTPSSSPSGAPAAAAVRSCCGQVEPGQEQEQYLAAEALAGFRVESVVGWDGDTLAAGRTLGSPERLLQALPCAFSAGLCPAG